jgi:hypothetical protein
MPGVSSTWRNKAVSNLKAIWNTCVLVKSDSRSEREIAGWQIGDGSWEMEVGPPCVAVSEAGCQKVSNVFLEPEPIFRTYGE